MFIFFFFFLDNQIRSEGAAYLAELLLIHPSLTSLNLYRKFELYFFPKSKEIKTQKNFLDNQIEDSGLTLLSFGLQRNQTIQKLNLGGKKPIEISK